MRTEGKVGKKPRDAKSRAAAKTSVAAHAARRKVAGSAKRAGKPATRTMTLSQWLAIPDAPVQRDTPKHWNDVKEKLSVLREAHRTVVMGVTEAGEEFKLDGHTRSYGWANGLTDAVPDTVTVVVTYVKDVDAIIEEYYTYDGTGQVKDAADQLFSAFKQFDIKHKSTFFAGCTGIVAAMKEALWEVSRLYEIDGLPSNARKVSVATCVQFFQEQLRALDSINPTKSRFSGPPTSAFLLAHFKYSELGKHVGDVEEFFKRHQDDAGVKNAKMHDSVYEMSKIMAKKLGGGASHRLKRLARILGCVERFVGPNGRTANWQNGASVDMEDYLLEEHALLTKNGKGARRNKGMTR
jgi:hypothetical protein